MRIRFLLMNAFTVGGTIRTTYHSAAALSRRHDVEIVSVYRRRRTARFEPVPGVPIRVLSEQVPPAGRSAQYPYGKATGPAEVLRRLPSVLVPSSEVRYRNFSVLTDLRLAAYLRHLDADVLVTTRPGLNLAAARLAPARVVRVGQEHMFLAAHNRRLRRDIARRYPRLDVVTALTERDADDYRLLLGGRTRVVRMPNAVPEPGVRASRDSTVVVAAGRLTRQKGFDLLIDAFAGIAGQFPGWQLHIYGSGSEKPALEERIQHLHLSGTVRLMGFAKDLDAKLAGAAVYAMSSRSEGFPMVLLEAMAVGLPAVSFDCRNGPAEIVTHGTDGLLVPDRDVSALGRGLATLMADRGKRHAMGEAAVVSSAAYRIEAVGDRWESLFEQLVAARTSSRREG